MVKDVKEVGVGGWLLVELHGQRGRVEQDGDEHRVLAEWRGGKRPEAVLEGILRNVSSDRLG